MQKNLRIDKGVAFIHVFCYPYRLVITLISPNYSNICIQCDILVCGLGLIYGIKYMAMRIHRKKVNKNENVLFSSQ